MAFNFSANQFEQPYTAKRLCNWELPKWYPPRPRNRKGSPKFIGNDRGHLLDCSNKVNRNAWGNFRSTYELPDKITREFANNYNECLLRRDKWSSYPRKTYTCPDGTIVPPKVKSPQCPSKCETLERILKFDKSRNYQLHPCEKRQCDNLEYVPGDFTPFEQQHSTRKLLLEDKYRRDYCEEAKPPLNKLYWKEPDRKLENIAIPPVQLSTPLPQTAALRNSSLSPQLCEKDLKTSHIDKDKELTKMIGSHSITGKPNERCPSPIVPAYSNFELARRMHQSNLDHQPLPDCLTDAAFRRLQITGSNPGLALNIEPIATGVGVKTYKAGPTHCTKMKVFRPRTSGVVPRAYHADNARILSAHKPDKKMSAMDLAICWDYTPEQEPLPAPHIDGSNESAAPAVFTCVKTSPRAESIASAGRSAGVFNNTLGESTFFDKDLMKRKLDFSGRRPDPVANAHDIPNLCRPMPCEINTCRRNNVPLNRCGKQYQSTPNILNDNQENKKLRQKYLSDDCDLMPTTTKATTTAEPVCKRHNFLRRARSRFCHRVAPEPQCCPRRNTCIGDHPRRMLCKAAFRAGIPHHNAAGDFISSDSGCSMNGHHALPKVLVVPQPRIPYMKRNYDIDTLVPPFTSYGGGAKEGGYPDYWRLASVYQHSYKPLEHRKRSLMQTVFK